VRAQEFKAAAQCGLNIIIHPDHLEDVIQYYEKFGYQSELINLLEQGLSLERTHNGIATDLGTLYAKYQPERLMDHINQYSNRLHIPKLIRSCELYHMWPEAVQLHQKYEQWDQAVITMMEHSPSAFKHEIFAQNVIRVTNYDLYYRAMIFYLEEQPMQLNDLLKLLAKKIDLVKCVQVMKRTGYISLIEPFLKSVQYQNVAVVNEALNEIYLEKQDYSSLRQSIRDFDSFESTTLAQSLETHELLDCRRISALLYRKNKKYQKSIDVSKRDQNWKDAMETVAESKDPALAEDLMRAIMDMDDKELFAAMLYSCYSLIKPDVAMELAWRKNMFEFVMPYFIQQMHDMSKRVESVQKSTDDIKKKEEKKEKEKVDQPLDMNAAMMFPGDGMGMGVPQIAAIMPAPGMMGPMGGMNMSPGLNNMGGMGGMPNMGSGGFGGSGF
jgi:clathrin heavy chain